MERDDKCIFCKIIQGQIPSKNLYEDDDTVVFMDIDPASDGHCLVVPKYHCCMFSELPEKYVIAVAKTVSWASKLLEKAGVRNYNILNNNGKLSGQMVQHVHVHLIPKTDSHDGLVGHFTASKAENVEQEYAKLKKLI